MFSKRKQKPTAAVISAESGFSPRIMQGKCDIHFYPLRFEQNFEVCLFSNVSHPISELILQACIDAVQGDINFKYFSCNYLS